MSDPLFMTDADLADALGKSRGFVQQKCRTKAWPHLRVGKSFRFTAEHVAAITAMLEVKPSLANVAANSWGHKTRGGSR